jgi:hypothetical protein
MWAVIGAWRIGPSAIYELRAQVPTMASFMDEHNDYTKYWPELPSFNRGHAGEIESASTTDRDSRAGHDASTGNQPEDRPSGT